MQRAMRRSDEAAGGLDRERQSLLEQLRTAEQVGPAGLAATPWHSADRTSLAVLETQPHLVEHALVAMPRCSMLALCQSGALTNHPARLPGKGPSVPLPRTLPSCPAGALPAGAGAGGAAAPAAARGGRHRRDGGAAGGCTVRCDRRGLIREAAWAFLVVSATNGTERKGKPPP